MNARQKMEMYLINLGFQVCRDAKDPEEEEEGNGSTTEWVHPEFLDYKIFLSPGSVGYVSVRLEKSSGDCINVGLSDGESFGHKLIKRLSEKNELTTHFDSLIVTCLGIKAKVELDRLMLKRALALASYVVSVNRLVGDNFEEADLDGEGG